MDHGDYHGFKFVLGCTYSASGSDLFEQLVRFKENQSVDISVQEDTLFRRNKRLVIFDADMKFLQCEVIDGLDKLAEAESEMQAIIQKTMDGEKEFSEALHQRVALLKGLPESRPYDLLPFIPMTSGVEGLVRIIKHLGYKIG